MPPRLNSSGLLALALNFDKKGLPAGQQLRACQADGYEIVYNLQALTSQRFDYINELALKPLLATVVRGQLRHCLPFFCTTFAGRIPGTCVLSFVVPIQASS